VKEINQGKLMLDESVSSY